MPLALIQLLPADAMQSYGAWHIFFKSMVAGLGVFVLRQTLSVYKPVKIEGILSHYSFVSGKVRKAVSRLIFFVRHYLGTAF